MVAGSAAALRTGVIAGVWAECGFHDDDDDDDDGDGASVVLVVRQRGFLSALVNLPASSSQQLLLPHGAAVQKTHARASFLRLSPASVGSPVLGGAFKCFHSQ